MDEAATGGAGGGGLLRKISRVFFFYLRKRVSPVGGVKTDVSVSSVSDKSVYVMHVSGRIMITQQANYLIIFVTLAVFSSLILLIKFFSP